MEQLEMLLETPQEEPTHRIPSLDEVMEPLRQYKHAKDMLQDYFAIESEVSDTARSIPPKVEQTQRKMMSIENPHWRGLYVKGGGKIPLAQAKPTQINHVFWNTFDKKQLQHRYEMAWRNAISVMTGNEPLYALSNPRGQAHYNWSELICDVWNAYLGSETETQDQEKRNHTYRSVKNLFEEAEELEKKRVF